MDPSAVTSHSVVASQRHKIEQYSGHRPEYPSSLWGIVATYHQGDLRKAHDIGSGYGNGIEGLLRFLNATGRDLTCAVLTEPKMFLIEAARSRLPSLFPETSFAYRNKKGHDNWDEPLGLRDGHLDLVMCCQAIHWMVLGPTLDQIKQTLRPNGTFVAVVYAPLPIVIDNVAATTALRCLIERHVDQLLKENWMDEDWKRLMRQLYLGLEGLPLVHGQWKHAKLIEMNCMEGWWCPDAYKPDATSNGIVKYSEDGNFAHHIQPDGFIKFERIVVPVDANWRRTVASTEWLKEMLLSFQLNFSEADWSSDEWKELEQGLAGQELHLEWPVHILLARKEENQT